MTIARTCLVVWLCCSAAAAWAQETRAALVIGNAAYARAGALDNPVRDAEAVAQALREVGFQTVQVEHDLGHDGLVQALRRFEDVADRADWALVYYAGHGIEVGGVNYLVPVDARLRSDKDVEEEAVSLSQVQKRLEGARKLRLVILDACRDNPFLSTMRRTLASRSVGRGLARPELPQTGSLVAYSAAAGQTALDGETARGNSPYAAALVKNLTKPDIEVNLLFRLVRAEVLRETGNRQEPATYESLPADRFVFRPAPPVASAPLAASVPPAAFPSPAASLPPAAPPPPAPGPMAALAPVLPVPAITPDRRARVEACDRLAAHPDDADRPAGIAGVAFEAIDGDAAIAACRAAVAALGDEPLASSPAGSVVSASPRPDRTEVRRTLYQLGRALQAGKRHGESRPPFERAAAGGSVAAMTILGVLYLSGDGVARDYGTARGWFEKAAARGDTYAMTGLGVLYQDSLGVAQDYAAALDWYGKAAAAGNNDGMTQLGVLYQYGHGVSQNYRAARFWYEKAAAGGNARAMTKLGILYDEGLGMPQDDATARGWYEKAAAAGDEEAPKLLDALGQKHQ